MVRAVAGYRAVVCTVEQVDGCISSVAENAANEISGTSSNRTCKHHVGDVDITGGVACVASADVTNDTANLFACRYNDRITVDLFDGNISTAVSIGLSDHTARASVTGVGGLYVGINQRKILDYRAALDTSEQTLGVVGGFYVQTGNGLAVTVKGSAKRAIPFTNGSESVCRSSLAPGCGIALVEGDVSGQNVGLGSCGHIGVYKAGEICQLLCVCDLIGGSCASVTACKCGCNGAIPNVCACRQGSNCQKACDHGQSQDYGQNLLHCENPPN